MKKRIKTTLNEFLAESAKSQLVKSDGVDTSFFSVTIDATPNQLISALGKPHMIQNDGNDKVNMEWGFKIKSTGVVFTIYDWKEYVPLEMDTIYEWHIGGHNENDCLKGKELLLGLLK